VAVGEGRVDGADAKAGGGAAASRRRSIPARRRPSPPASQKAKGRRVTTAISPDVSESPSWERRRGRAGAR
jgi:hypothetical protein